MAVSMNKNPTEQTHLKIQRSKLMNYFLVPGRFCVKEMFFVGHQQPKNNQWDPDDPQDQKNPKLHQGLFVNTPGIVTLHTQVGGQPKPTATFDLDTLDDTKNLCAQTRVNHEQERRRCLHHELVLLLASLVIQQVGRETRQNDGSDQKHRNKHVDQKIVQVWDDELTRTESD